ncbi:MAG: alkaline phosphatase family protein [Motilibacteraceae bacterium]
MSKKRLRTAVVLPVAGAVALGGGTAFAAAGGIGGFGQRIIGRQADGSVLVPTDQRVTPAGTSVEQSGRPLSLALAPDGRTAVNETYDGKGLFTVTDLVNHTVLQQISPPRGIGSGNVSYGGLLYSKDGKTLWAAQTANLLRFDVAEDGTLANPVAIPLPRTNGRQPIPASIAYAPDAQHLLVTLNGTNALAVLDTGTGEVVRSIPVGNAPRDVVVIGDRAYVANQGGRTATASDRTNDSYGTAIVANDENGSPSTGTVSEVDPVAGTVVRTFDVGLGPSALLAHGTDLLVANSNSDTVSVIDTVRGTVGATINVNPLPGSPIGSSPNSLAMVDDKHLAVSLGTANAVAVYTYAGAGAQATFQGLIPTGWYPGTVVWDGTIKQLVVAAQKGVGSLGPTRTSSEGPGTATVTGHSVYSDIGEVTTVPMPKESQYRELTQQVWHDNQWTAALAQQHSQGKQRKPVAIPRRDGDPSTIKHVFLIVKENRTYDQVLGDDPRGNGDPALAQFGGKTTPNQHALAKAGPLLDNIYSSGTMSADGHQWLTQAMVDEYLTQSIGNYTRSYPYNGGDSMAYSATGFLWDNAAHHGVSAKDWGEYTNAWTDAAGQGDPHSWTQWYQNTQALEGKGGTPTIPADQYHASTDVPSLTKILNPSYPGFQLQIPDQYRADLFLQDLKAAEKTGDLPQLNLLTIMDDHTAGTSPSYPTPSAMVADNDLALGRIIDGISHSSFGKDSAVFVMEDDSQDGVDHVDGHRNPTFVWSPYARKGAVVHDFYTQLNVVRTIEQILGLPPMTQMDLAAEPMFAAFTDHPDFTPYTALPNEIPLDTLNSQATAQLTAASTTTSTADSTAPSTAAAAKAWSDWSAEQDFAGPDRANPAQLNRDIWYSQHGFATPYPGDSTVLLPQQIPGADLASDVAGE